MSDASVFASLDNGFITITGGKATEMFRTDQVAEVIRIEYGGDFVGPIKKSFWIFDLGDSAVIVPDCAPGLRRDILPQLAPAARPGIIWQEGSCFTPPKQWSKPRLLLPPDKVDLKRISKQELNDTLKSFGHLHPVHEFGDEGL